MCKGKGQDVPVYVMKAYRQSTQASGQPHGLAALLPEKEPWVLFKQEAVWAPKAV